jgi:hypothetical protein
LQTCVCGCVAWAAVQGKVSSSLEVKVEELKSALGEIEAAVASTPNIGDIEPR